MSPPQQVSRKQELLPLSSVPIGPWGLPAGTPRAAMPFGDPLGASAAPASSTLLLVQDGSYPLWPACLSSLGLGFLI